jgi:adenylate kinase
MHKKHIMLMGIQGSGKGTQAALITRHFGYISLETGAILRAVLENPSHKHFKEVSETVPHGKMTPDAIIFDLIQEFFDAHPGDHILIDGAVRNIAQRKFFDAITTDYIVIHIELSELEALERLQGRRMDPVTKEIFGIDFHGDTNPATGNTLVTRLDDQDVAKIHERFAWYATDIVPLLNSWKEDNYEFYTLNGAQHREDVWQDIKEIVKEMN